MQNNPTKFLLYKTDNNQIKVDVLIQDRGYLSDFDKLLLEMGKDDE
jgi:hypothetical protein